MKLPHIIVSVPAWPEGLQKVRDLAIGGTVQLVDPALQPGAWPVELIREGTVLLCEVPPTNVDEMPSLAWIQLSSAGYEQLRGLALGRAGCASPTPAAPTTCRSPSGASPCW